LDSVVIFFHNTLQVASLLRDDNRRKINKNLEPKPKIGPNHGTGKPLFSAVMGA